MVLVLLQKFWKYWIRVKVPTRNWTKHLLSLDNIVMMRMADWPRKEWLRPIEQQHFWSSDHVFLHSDAFSKLLRSHIKLFKTARQFSQHHNLLYHGKLLGTNIKVKISEISFLLGGFGIGQVSNCGKTKEYINWQFLLISWGTVQYKNECMDVY